MRNLTRPARELVAELACDGICSAAQAVRLRGDEALEELLAAGAAQVLWVPWRRSHGARGALRVAAVRLTGAGRALAEGMGARPSVAGEREFAHSAGLAELRWLLGADRERVVKEDGLRAWAAASGRWTEAMPDALWWNGDELVALEYDHGSYGPALVARKLRALASLADRVVWGTSVASRAGRVRSAWGGEPVLVVPPVDTPAWLLDRGACSMALTSCARTPG